MSYISVPNKVAVGSGPQQFCSVVRRLLHKSLSPNLSISDANANAAA